MKKIYLSFALVVSIVTALSAQTVTPWALSPTNSYSFTSWDPNSAGGTYPPSMLFKQYTTGSTEPVVTADPTETWRCVYNATVRCYITGKGDSGVVFRNAGGSLNAAQCNNGGITGKQVGAALLTLSTTNCQSVNVSFKAGTLIQTDSTQVYEMVLQGRTDSATASAWTDIAGGLYSTSGVAAGTIQSFSNIVLPSSFNNLPIVQLRWRIYNFDDASGGGTRPAILLDDINVTADLFTGISYTANDKVILSVYPNPASDNISFNKAISGKMLDVSGREVVSFQNAMNVSLAGISTGIYTLHSTTGEVVKVSVK